MEKTTKELLQEVESEKLLLEDKIKDNQKTLLEIQENFEKDLVKLKELQGMESSLRQKIYEQQKDSLHKSLNAQSMKKFLGGVTPFFTKIKVNTINKAKNIKDYIDGNYIDKVWLEEKYNDYKKVCIQKGEAIQSKEEFQKIALSIRNVQNEMKELSLHEIIGKVSKELGHAKKSISSVMENIKIEEKIENLLNKKTIAKSANQSDYSHLEINKKNTLFMWITEKNPDLFGDSSDLYEMYISYVNLKFSKHVDDMDKICYSKKSGSFTQAINRYIAEQKINNK